MNDSDPADVHTGTDRVELTNDEREALETWERDGIYACPHPDSCPTPRACRNEFGLFAVVESIVAARVQALTAEREELRERIATLEEYLNER